MASTPPDENTRVTIDGIQYEIRDAGTLRYAVFDEFSGHLGYFELRGKAIVPDDFGVHGAPPIVTIAKAWQTAHGPAPEKPSFHVCRIAKVSDVDDYTLRCARAYANWLKQCGAKAAFVAYDEEAKKMTLVSVWGARSRMTNALEKEPPAGASEPSSAEVEIIGLAQDF
jgi:hypothetical protein